ncbi:MAG: glucosamine-6-phosphate deaminase, partial [Verrucomicrobiota bacterium]
QIRQFKGLLRRSEARAAVQACGLPVNRIRFLDLAFYENGRYRQFAPGDADLAALAATLRDIAPHQLFATGHRDDPSTVAAVCFSLIQRACRQLAGEAWLRDCRLWLYRGVDSPWNTAEIDMAVPFSPRELTQKIQSIYQHKSQRSQTAVEPGLHELWQQAEHHNRSLAETYDRLGLANYEALEAFELGEI